MATPRRQMVYEPRRLIAENVEDLRREMQEELDRMAMVLGQLTEFRYFPQSEEPQRFEEGSIRYFREGAVVTGGPLNGTQAGLHQFRGGQWRRLNDGN